MWAFALRVFETITKSFYKNPMKRLFAIALLIFLPFFFSPKVFAQNSFGDWSVGTADDGTPFALTTNSFGQSLGKFCNSQTKTCYWMIVLETTCNLGTESLILINTDIGVFSKITTCWNPLVSGGRNFFRYFLSDPDGMDQIVAKAQSFSIAMGVGNSDFEVYKFSMSGAQYALGQWRIMAGTWFQNKHKPAKQKGVIS